MRVTEMLWILEQAPLGLFMLTELEVQASSPM